MSIRYLSSIKDNIIKNKLQPITPSGSKHLPRQPSLNLEPSPRLLKIFLPRLGKRNQLSTFQLHELAATPAYTSPANHTHHTMIPTPTNRTPQHRLRSSRFHILCRPIHRPNISLFPLHFPPRSTHCTNSHPSPRRQNRHCRARFTQTAHTRDGQIWRGGRFSRILSQTRESGCDG